MSKSKLNSNSRKRKQRSPQSSAQLYTPPASTSTKGNGEKNGVATSAGNKRAASITGKIIAELLLKLAGQKNPSADDLERLRSQIVATPAAWNLPGDLMASIRHRLIEKMSGGVMLAIARAETDILAKRLDHDTAPPIERLLIDHILTVRLRLIHAETCYNSNVVGKPISVSQAQYWDDLLSSTQTRFLRAIETLARVRRLARNTPALQINIANEGGQQVNVQGETNGEKASPTS